MNKVGEWVGGWLRTGADLVRQLVEELKSLLYPFLPHLARGQGSGDRFLVVAENEVGLVAGQEDEFLGGGRWAGG